MLSSVFRGFIIIQPRFSPSPHYCFSPFCKSLQNFIYPSLPFVFFFFFSLAIMDGERKKRKKDIDYASASEEGNEDEKMEKFFALIRSTRDVKERLLTASNADTSKAILHKEEGGVDGKQQQPAAAAAIWNPAFLPEDFMEGEHHRQESPVRRRESSSVPPDLNIPNTTHDESAAAGPSSTKTEEDRGENGGGGDDDDDRHDLDLNLSL